MKEAIFYDCLVIDERKVSVFSVFSTSNLVIAKIRRMKSSGTQSICYFFRYFCVFTIDVCLKVSSERMML